MSALTVTWGRYSVTLSGISYMGWTEDRAELDKYPGSGTVLQKTFGGEGPGLVTVSHDSSCLQNMIRVLISII